MAILAKNIINEYIDELDNKEIGVISELTLYQTPNTGEINLNYIYYRDIAKACNMSERHFYNVMDTLKDKGILIVDKEKGVMKLKGNTVEECKKENGGSGYITLPGFFSEKDFHNTIVKSKRLIIKLLAQKPIPEGKYFHIKRDKLMDEWLHIKRVAHCNILLNQISKWFDWEFYKNAEGEELYRLKLKAIYRVQLSTIAQKTRSKRASGEVKYIFRKKRIKEVADTVVKDFAQLLNQYKDQFYKCLHLLNESTADGRIFRCIIRNAYPA